MGNDPSALIVAVLVVLVLALVLRWVFAPSGPRRGRPKDAADAAAAAELGLLTVVTPGVERQEALRLRHVLQEAGIRSSMSRRADGRFDVLVFAADAGRARAHFGPEGGG